MKVLHVFTLATTAETFFDGQFKFLTENGHRITLACSSDGKRIFEFANRNSIDYTPIEIPRSIHPAKDFNAVSLLIKLIRKEKFDIVVGHTPKGALLAMLASRIAGCRNRVYLRHGLIYTTASGIKRSILKVEEKFVSALATKIINVSPSLGKLAVKDNLNRNSKQLVIGKGTCGGIDATNIFNPQKLDPKILNSIKLSHSLSNNDFIIGFCGRLCKDKGIIELIEGFQLFKSHYPTLNTKLLLIGGYDSRDILPELIHKNLESNPDIIHVGHISKNIQYYYSLMDVFVFPSHREGFGMSVIEASAMEKPILVSRSHGCVDSIVKGVTGEYIELNKKGVTEGLERMLSSEKRQKLGKNGRKWVLENFDHSVMWSKIKDFYSSL